MSKLTDDFKDCEKGGHNFTDWQNKAFLIELSIASYLETLMSATSHSH